MSICSSALALPAVAHIVTQWPVKTRARRRNNCRLATRAAVMNTKEHETCGGANKSADEYLNQSTVCAASKIECAHNTFELLITKFCCVTRHA